MDEQAREQAALRLQHLYKDAKVAEMQSTITKLTQERDSAEKNFEKAKILLEKSTERFSEKEFKAKERRARDLKFRSHEDEQAIEDLTKELEQLKSEKSELQAAHEKALADVNAELEKEKALAVEQLTNTQSVAMLHDERVAELEKQIKQLEHDKESSKIQQAYIRKSKSNVQGKLNLSENEITNLKRNANDKALAGKERLMALLNGLTDKIQLQRSARVQATNTPGTNVAGNINVEDNDEFESAQTTASEYESNVWPEEKDAAAAS